MDLSQLSQALSNGEIPDPSEVDMSSLSPDNQALLSTWLREQKQQGADQFNASLVQMLGGLLGGIGQAQSQRDLLNFNNQLGEQLQQWGRNFVQSGDFWGASVPMSAPATPRALTRMNGNPVYAKSGGLISNAISNQQQQQGS